MASIAQSNSNSFLTWQKVNGALPLADLQADGLPSVSWTPVNLAKASRTVLSWWDAREDVTEATGVSNLGDQGVNSLDFAQGTGSAQPTLSGTGTTSVITYDHLNDYLSQPVTSGNYQNLTHVEVYSIVLFDGTQGRKIFTFSDANGSLADILTLTTNGAANTAGLIMLDNSSSNIIRTTLGVTDGRHVVNWRFDGSAWKIYIDNVLMAITVVSGSNKGFFVGSMTNKTLIDILSTASIIGTSSSYTWLSMKLDLIFGGTTDAALSNAAERTAIFDYMNAQYSLGL